MTMDREKLVGSGVIVVTSRPSGDRREFEVAADSDPDIAPALEGLAHEEELVGRMAGLGFNLTFVGGGSRTDEVRRFYFRRT